jgi:outer membrane lipoprotein-sorting protein
MTRKLSLDKLLDKLLIITISLTGLSLNFALTSKANAQPITPPPTENNNSPNRSNNEPDLETLATALEKFFLQQNYQTESQTSLTFSFASSSESTVTMTSQTKIISVAPNKFRAELNFSPIDGSSQTKKYLVVSNGETVWIYRPDLKQYSTSTYEKFNASTQVLWLGLFSILGNPTQADIEEIKQNNNLKKSVAQVDGKDHFFYEYSNQEDQTATIMIVSPENRELKELRIVTKEQNMDVLMQEKYTSRIQYTVGDRNLFNFMPSQDTKQVSDLEIDPF